MIALLQLVAEAARRPPGSPQFGPQGWELFGSIHTSILLLSALMLLLIWAGRRDSDAARERPLAWAWGFVFAKEFLGVAVRTPWLHPVDGPPGLPPPVRLTVESALETMAAVFIVAASIRYFRSDDRGAGRLVQATAAATALAAAAALAIGGGVPRLGPPSGPPPAALSVQSSFLLIGIAALVAGAVLSRRSMPGSSSRVAFAGCAMFIMGHLLHFSRFLSSPLGYPGRPVSGAFVVVGLFAYAYLYVRERSARYRSNIEALEERVDDRTRELEAALDELYRANELLREQSTVDSLTGVRNRRCFDEVLAKEWLRAERSGAPLALAFVDLDEFKAINDRHGHPVGDDCLVRTATALQEIARRPGDVVARFGGDEFAVLLSDADSGGAQQLLERARKRVEQLRGHASAPDLAYTVSIGVASCRPAAGGEPEQLVRRADDALYRAKQQGRNCVVSPG